MRHVIDLSELDRSSVALAGGKASRLGELVRMEGIRVPSGFCVTTDAFLRFVALASRVDDRLARLSPRASEEHDRSLTREEHDWSLALKARAGIAELSKADAGIAELSAELRRALEDAEIPGDLAAAITAAVEELGAGTAYAVRSSATAEDLPDASFAGQHESYLNVVGPSAVVEHVRRCWVSLFADRAVAYRLRHGVDHRQVRMAVVVQRMVPARAAGVLFTADPVTSHRKVAVVEANFGLGDALASGRTCADRYEVRSGTIMTRSIAQTRLADDVSEAGEPGRPTGRVTPALTDPQVEQLARLGRRIEAHFGEPQDIEWCLADGEFWIVQSRPITTLFPIPEAADRDNHVYVSVGHGQMMTGAMRPLGVSVWQLTAMVPMHEADGRLFVDVTERLASPGTRGPLLEVMGRGDPLIADALRTLVEREDGFLPSRPDEGPGEPPRWAAPAEIDTDPAIVAGLIERDRASVAALERDIRMKSGPELFEFLLEAFEEHRRVLGDRLSHQAIMAGMQAAWWLGDRLEAWLGERDAVDTLTLSAPGNVTSEMGLALLDVADAIRPHPQVVAFLRHVDPLDGGAFLDELPGLRGGPEARRAFRDYLERYGMRCAGEIDITTPRWSEQPAALVPALLNNVDTFGPGEAGRRFERGRALAEAKQRELLERLEHLPDGLRKAEETCRMIDRLRTFAGYREYPKYGIVSRYLIYKRALLAEARRLVREGVLRESQDSFYLTFHELQEAVSTRSTSQELIDRRQKAFRAHQALTPPRVITSDGEAIAGAYRRDDLPADALIGLAVSSGTVAGRARVISDIARADLEPGDILVTTYTDPSWTPLFPALAALVTEVGGLMSHGAVIAREYGLPAVIGVEDATRLISDGQRIQVNGSRGYVQILADDGRERS